MRDRRQGLVGVVNQRTGERLAEDIETAESFRTRLCGLMLRRALRPGLGLRIEPCSSIHMLFMRFRIDAVFYDRQGYVTKVARDLRPWTGIAFGGGGTRGVIEIPAGAAGGTVVGDELLFE